MKWACIFLTAGIVNAGELVTISPGGNLADSTAGTISRSGGSAIWKGTGGTTVTTKFPEVAAWVATIAPGENVRTSPRAGGAGWTLTGNGKSGEIVPQSGGNYLARYGGKSFTITLATGNIWRVAPR